MHYWFKNYGSFGGQHFICIKIKMYINYEILVREPSGGTKIVLLVYVNCNICSFRYEKVYISTKTGVGGQGSTKLVLVVFRLN